MTLLGTPVPYKSLYRLIVVWSEGFVAAKQPTANTSAIFQVSITSGNLAEMTELRKNARRRVPLKIRGS